MSLQLEGIFAWVLKAGSGIEVVVEVFGVVLLLSAQGGNWFR